MRCLVALGLIGSALNFMACDLLDQDSSKCPEGGVGTLQVNGSRTLDGAVPRVTISGPGGTQQIASGTELRLPTGIYSIQHDLIAGENPVVRRAYTTQTSTGQFSTESFCVKEGKDETATVIINLVVINSSQKLWMSREESEYNHLMGVSVDNLNDFNAPLYLSNVKGSVASAVFDRIGGLWTVSSTPDISLVRYPASTLREDVARQGVQLTGETFAGALPGEQVLAFDLDGNLWVSVGHNRKIVRYTPDQLATSGSPVPGVELTGTDKPSALAFDRDGNLWVALAGSHQVARYDASHLGASFTGAPDLIIEANTPSPNGEPLRSPGGLAFDSEGSLWVYYEGAFARFAPSALNGSGTVSLTPAPHIRLLPTTQPGGFAFDESGGLWIGMPAGRLGRFSPEQLSSSGDKAPALVKYPNLTYNGWLAFYPAPANLPLYHSLP